MQLVAPPGTRVTYTESGDTRALIELLMFLNDCCITPGVLRPTGGQYLMRPRAGPLQASFAARHSSPLLTRP